MKAELFSGISGCGPSFLLLDEDETLLVLAVDQAPKNLISQTFPSTGHQGWRMCGPRKQQRRRKRFAFQTQSVRALGFCLSC